MPIKAVVEKARVPIKIWSDLEKVESEALNQLVNTANLPFVFKQVVVMPDVHVGIGATIGSVIATEGAICPAAVGVDIGCGMMAVKTTLNANLVQDKIKKIRQSIERSIPVGMNENKRIEKSVDAWAGWAQWNEKVKESGHFYSGLSNKARNQLGSLGGGNHFIEICLDKESNVWAMLHSGSRGIGNVIARRHIESARGLLKSSKINLPDANLAYFLENSKEFKHYYSDLIFCQNYALQNRIEMMNRVLKDLSYAVNEGKPIERLLEVSCHHNYVERETHFRKEVLVTRKGAVSAKKGQLGIIPGSMGAKSFIVEGLGNPESFHSCSHGAGRRLSRRAAKEAFTVEDLKKQTDGIECRKDAGVLDEIPGAYKSIDEVMANQNDLVKVVAELRQIMCVKG